MEYTFEPLVEVEATDINGSDYRVELTILARAYKLADVWRNARNIPGCFGYEVRWDDVGYDTVLVLFFHSVEDAQQFQSVLGGK